LRCQVEFTRDIAGSRLCRSMCTRSELSSAEGLQAAAGCAGTFLRTAATADARPHVPRPPPSYRSAPALLLGGTGSRQSSVPISSFVQGCLEGDCLPPEAQTWVEGDAMPRPVARLSRGDRVLCFDRLGGSMKHTEVLQVKEAEGPTEWTSVTLADGAMLEVTADHPVHPAPAPGSEWGPYGPSLPTAPISASHLEPGRDSLLVLKVVPVPVQSVACRKAESARRISVTLQQPERHAMFVASAGSARPGIVGLQTVAVESSDAAGLWQDQIRHRNSFLNVAPYAADHPAAGAPNSAPPSLHGHAELRCMHAAASAAPPTVQSSQSTLSQSSEALDDRTAVVLLPGQARSAWEVDRDEPVSLGEMLRTKAAGWQSRGSHSHAMGSCRVCAHENKAQHRGHQQCVNGTFCKFCHGTHPNETDAKREKRRQDRFQAKSQKRAQLFGGEPYTEGDISDS